MNNLEEPFGAWLKLVLPDSGIQERDQRLGVIRKFVPTVKTADVLGLVFAFYSEAPDLPVIQRLNSAMLPVDTGFSSKNTAELAVLAAGVLFEIFEEGGDLAAAAALATLCADFGALSSTNHITQVVENARQFILDEGTRVREKSLELPNLGDTLRAALEPPEGSKEEDSDGEARLSRVIDELSGYGDKLKLSLGAIEARRAEQSDILYWLLSGRHHIAGAALKGLKKEQVALFIAAELANLTRQILGPPSASAILSTLLDQCKGPNAAEVTLGTCVRSIDENGGATYLTKRKVVHPVISPISFALVKAEETGWQDGWQNAVRVQTRQSSSVKYPALKFAEQLYREALLSRVLGEN